MEMKKLSKEFIRCCECKEIFRDMDIIYVKDIGYFSLMELIHT